jgi:hypothetical protein
MEQAAADDHHREVEGKVPNRLPGVPTANAEGEGKAVGALTPVMARLGPVELDTLNVLISAGIAGSRSECIRWALNLVRERPTFAKLRERSREIDSLKTEF